MGEWPITRARCSVPILNCPVLPDKAGMRSSEIWLICVVSASVSKRRSREANVNESFQTIVGSADHTPFGNDASHSDAIVDFTDFDRIFQRNIGSRYGGALE